MVAAKNLGRFERNRELQKACGGELACINRRESTGVAEREC
jgi:hypothetical protein